MPELPDVDVYVEHIAARTVGRALARVRLASPFVLRTADPPLAAASGRRVARVARLGKRIVLTLAGAPTLHLVVHLMIAGRFRWKDAGAPIPGKVGLAALDFEGGTLVLTEASSKKRASLHLVRDAGLAALDPGGMEVLGSTPGAFGARLRSENHTLKRALTDPHLFSGIGNAYSDEILHHARMSPVRLTSRLTDAEIAALHASIHHVLEEWTARLRREAGAFPEKVTAFRPEMAVHGKYGQPCPRCGSPVQRIRYAANESNYCPPCQTEGKLLADRSLSRLMRGDWPKTLEELETRKKAARGAEVGSFAARAASFIPARPGGRAPTAPPLRARTSAVGARPPRAPTAPPAASPCEEPAGRETTDVTMSSPLIISDKVTLPGSDLEWTAVRSSGPGGQNVNKVASKVELSFDFEATVALAEPAKARLRDLARNTLDAEGRIFIKSDKTRDQVKNLADARAKLKELILKALVVPKTRRPTKVSKAQKAKRLTNKKKVGAKKAARRPPRRDD